MIHLTEDVWITKMILANERLSVTCDFGQPTKSDSAIVKNLIKIWDDHTDWSDSVKTMTMEWTE
jgi:hypothetical protein